VTSALEGAGVAPGSIDLALLCAATKHEGHTVLDIERLRDTLQVNVLSAAELAAWLCSAGAMAPRALGVVSSMGRWHGMHSSAGYNASKAALSIWAESLELDLSLRGTAPPTVTVIEPGLFESGMTASGGPRRLLSVPRRRLAGRIVDAVAAGRRSLRTPGWFTALTWGICLAGRGLRVHVFARAKPGSPP
jgi:NAD(P)-dependent dehydrogenase (short-subunit alcohol dehydrogenase family)